MRTLLFSLLFGMASLAASAQPTDAARAFAYKVNVSESSLLTFESFPLDAPATVTDGPNVVDPDDDGIADCDFTNDDFDTLYCLTYTGTLLTVDVASGATSVIGSGSYASNVNDIAYNVADDAWYAIASDCGVSSEASLLYRFDIGTGAATQVGSTTAVRCGITLAADSDGALYGYGAFFEVVSFRVDPATGVFTVLGPTGLSIAYQQAMDCDASTGVCYAFAFTINRTSGLYTLNKTTGRLSLVAPFPGNPEYAAGAIAAPRQTVAAEDGPRDTAALTLTGVNPVRDAIRVAVSAGDAQSVRVRVFDALGREVARLHDGPVAAGQRLDLSADASAWSPGLYVVRAEGEGALRSRTFTVVR